MKGAPGQTLIKLQGHSRPEAVEKRAGCRGDLWWSELDTAHTPAHRRAPGREDLWWSSSTPPVPRAALYEMIEHSRLAAKKHDATVLSRTSHGQMLRNAGTVAGYVTRAERASERGGRDTNSGAKAPERHGTSHGQAEQAKEAATRTRVQG